METITYKQCIHQPFHYHWLELLQVSLKDLFCHDKHAFVSWQNFCRDKIMFVATSILLCFVTTITRLSWQKLYLWQLPPMVFHRHHHTTTLHDDDWQEAHVRVCVISRCPLTQCWTKIKVTAWATAAFRQANNCAWPAGVPSLNAGLKTRCHCLGNCCIQKGKCQCITSRCPITKCWTS